MTMNPDVVTKAQAVFEGRLPDRWTALERSKAKIMQEAGMRNALQSSSVIWSIFNLFSTEFKVLATLAWQDLHRVNELIGFEATPALPDDLKAAVRSSLTPLFTRIEELYKESLRFQQSAIPPLAPALEEALLPVDAEIDLYAAWKSKSAPPTPPTAPQPTIFHIYSPVGAIVSGASAQVTVQQIHDYRPVIIQALDLLREVAAGIPDYNDIVDLAAEAETEVKRETPNPLKVKSLLGGLASAIQTIASLRPAYEAIKSAAALIGIPMP